MSFLRGKQGPDGVEHVVLEKVVAVGQVLGILFVEFPEYVVVRLVTLFLEFLEFVVAGSSSSFSSSFFFFAVSW